MNAFKRFISHTLFWLAIWFFLWFSNGKNPFFIENNSVVYSFQILLFAGLIFFGAPKLLFEKKYLIFTFLSLFFILGSAYISSEIMQPPPANRPRLGLMRRMPGSIPTKFFVNLLMMAISFVLATLLETFVYVQRKEKGIALAKAELNEAELKFLKMQINPHFLFNALNNIYALSVTNSEKTQEGISTLSQMLRYVLYDCERPKVPLQKELEYISHFIELFKLKSSKDFNINFTQEIENDSIMVAPMLFVPFIENAFKHSGIEKGGESFVNISLKSSSNSIDFKVENSLPTEPLITDEHGGIGLQNVKKRLEILYSEKHQLSIENKNTFKVILKVNI
ncbi:sensor histidine kinase [Mesonia sp. K4-1]|uniref:sensor histidine kinase n=1 Tax=Mesonia sp. K4-1 TaxID=2602760 RepID=UPI0011C7239B|nr:histidine kinase [Mesonia sp. K4-1]TXK76837.1 histidine kinase [Mesonia sp. K4-1]